MSTELVKVKDTRLGEYESLLWEKSNLERKGVEIWREYLKKYGALRIRLYQATLECIKYRNYVTYCQKRVNHNQLISGYLMRADTRKAMDDYYKKLDRLIQDKEDSEMAKKEVSLLDIRRMQKAYRHTMKLIHPDLNPKVYQLKGVKELFEKTNVDYRCNQVESVLADERMAISKARGYRLPEDDDADSISHLDEKIAKLKKAIEEKLHSVPYLYEDLLCDEKLAKDHRDELESEIKAQAAYLEVLKEHLKEFAIIEE